MTDPRQVEGLFSNQAASQNPSRVITRAAGTVEIHAPIDTITDGPVRVVALSLKPIEVQIARLDEMDCLGDRCSSSASVEESIQDALFINDVAAVSPPPKIPVDDRYRAPSNLLG